MNLGKPKVDRPTKLRNLPKKRARAEALAQRLTYGLLDFDSDCDEPLVGSRLEMCRSEFDDMEVCVPEKRQMMDQDFTTIKVENVKMSSEHVSVLEPMLSKAQAYKNEYAGCVVEEKFDGERILCKHIDGKTENYSRTLKQYASHMAASSVFGDLNIEFKDGKDHDVILDGELIYFVDGKYVPITMAGSRGAAKKQYVVFDVQYYDGWVTGYSWDERRVLLESIVENDTIKLSQYSDAVDVFKKFNDVIARGGEGLVVKPRKSAYVSKDRTHWMKLKAMNIVDSRCILDVEVVRAYKTKRNEWGILECMYDGKPIGRVSSGISRKDAFVIRSLVDCMGVPKCKIIAEVRGDLITTHGKIRHPVFVRIRDDLM